jgi:hypothetical protein
MGVLLEEHTEWALLRLPRTLGEEAMPGFFHHLYHRVKVFGVTIINILASIILSR